MFLLFLIDFLNPLCLISAKFSLTRWVEFRREFGFWPELRRTQRTQEQVDAELKRRFAAWKPGEVLYPYTLARGLAICFGYRQLTPEEISAEQEMRAHGW